MNDLLPEKEYEELNQFWAEFMMLGPTHEQRTYDLTALALDFSEWIEGDGSQPYYGLPEILAFFVEKQQRDGAAVNAWNENEGA